MHFNWKCRLVQVDLYNGRKMVVVVAVKRQVVTLTVLHLCISILPKNVLYICSAILAVRLKVFCFQLDMDVWIVFFWK